MARWHPARLLAAGSLAALLVAMAPLPAAAHEGHSHDDETPSTVSTGGRDGNDSSSGDGTASRERSQHGLRRLQGDKLRLCQQRREVVAGIMSRNVVRGQRHIELFDTIAGRTKAFYTAKGRTVDNYDQLVAAVAAARQAAADNLEAMRANTAFACDGDNPQAMAQAFAAGARTQAGYLKDYRQAVKNLIVAVKSAQGGEQ